MDSDFLESQNVSETVSGGMVVVGGQFCLGGTTMI